MTSVIARSRANGVSEVSTQIPAPAAWRSRHVGHVARAARIVRDGGIVAYATEYCFGIGCDPRDPTAVRRVLRIKHRPQHKGLIVLAADIDQLATYVDDIPAHVRATWPGPRTWLLPRRHDVPAWIAGTHATVAVRVTAHAPAAALCRAAGMAIVSTSANRAGQKPLRTYREVLQRFGAEVDYVLPGVVGDLAAPTPIRDAASGASVRG